MKRSTAFALVFRILIAVSTRTFFQPDEYFQALEPAHHIVFGYGHLTWEWLAENPIRCIIYPALNVPIYWLLKVFKLDETELLVGKSLKLKHGKSNDCAFIWCIDNRTEGASRHFCCRDRYLGTDSRSSTCWLKICFCNSEKFS